MSSERVIVISPRKSGTHLVQNLLVRLGYGIYGAPVTPKDGRPAFSLRERIELADRFLHPDEHVDVRADTTEFIRRTDQLVIQLARIWQIRLATANLSDVEITRPDIWIKLRMTPEVWTRPFQDTPPRLCLIFHSMDIWRMDPTFLNEWTTCGDPRIILNYRDPRDALVSMVNFFAGDAGIKFQRFPESAIFQPILASISDTADRIEYALRDPAMPLMADYESAISWFYHPHVCNVAFEDLVGPEGGGSTKRQQSVMERVADWVGANRDTAVDGLFDRNAFTFNKGQIGSWREVFTSRLETLFNDRFGHLLDVFGYD